MWNTLILCGLFGAFILLQENALGEVKSKSKEENVNLGEIVVSNEISEGSSPEDISAFVSIIDPKEYEGEFQTTSELIQKTVGARVVDFGGLGQRQTISIRGSSSEQVVVLLDGVKLNSTQNGSVDISSIPLEIIERIEILRGGEGALYGADAMGGVVNIITKKGQRSNPEAKPQLDLLATYGSFQTAEASVSIGDQINAMDYFFSYTHFNTKGDFPFLDDNGQTQTRINNNSLEESPFLRLGWEDPDIGRFELVEQFFWRKRGQPGFGQFQLPEAQSKEWRNFTDIRYLKKNLFETSFDLQITSFFSIEDFNFDDPQPQIGPTVTSDTKTNAYGGKIQLDSPLGEHQFFSFIVDLRQDEADVFSENPGANNFQNTESNRFTYAFAAKDEIHLFENEWSFLPALRFEDTTQTKGAVIPKLGIRYQPKKTLAFKGNIGRTFRNPTFNELFFPDTEFIGGNPNLVPEEGYSADIGLEVTTQKFFGSISAFFSDTSNAIFFVPISATRIEPINFSDDVINQGFEVALRFTPNEFFSLNSNYTFLDHFFENTRFRLPGRSVHDVYFRMVLSHPNWGKTYLEGQYLSEFSVTLPAAGGQLEPDRIILNTGFTLNAPPFWQWPLTFSFDAKNVNNVQNVNDSRDFPLPGRSFFGTLHFKY